MFQKINLQEFLKRTEGKQTAILFIKENGCRYCAMAESEMKRDEFADTLSSFQFYEASIDDEPGLPAELGLVGVPAFLKMDAQGRKRIKIGFEGIAALKKFILSD